MASSRKKRSRAVVTLLLCLAAVCIVAALVLYGLANRKLKALQQGADFEFTYAVTSQGGTTHPALYSILDQAGATEPVRVTETSWAGISRWMSTGMLSSKRRDLRDRPSTSVGEPTPSDGN